MNPAILISFFLISICRSLFKMNRISWLKDFFAANSAIIESFPSLNSRTKVCCQQKPTNFKLVLEEFR